MPLDEVGGCLLEVFGEGIVRFLFQTRWGWVGLGLLTIGLVAIAIWAWPAWWSWAFVVTAVLCGTLALVGFSRYRRGEAIIDD